VPHAEVPLTGKKVPWGGVHSMTVKDKPGSAE
jgi:hypothetical protein